SSKQVSFTYVHTTFADGALAQADGVDSSNKIEEQRIVRVDQPLDPESAKRKLEALPRFLLRPENQHRAIRKPEQEVFARLLERKRAGWLVADWGLGKDGFLACALEQLFGADKPVDVFRLNCGAVCDCEQLLAEAETQLGLSFPEFAA